MLKAQKKISKRELKEDAFISMMGKATTFYEEYKRTISYAILAVVVLVGGLFVYSRHKADQNEKANLALSKVYSLYDNNQYQVAIDGVTERGIVGLKSIVDNYGGTTAGNLARFYLANAYYNLDKFGEALKQFEDFSATDQLLTVSKYAGIGSCCEAMGQYEKAAENFEKAASKYPKDIDAPANFSRAADNYALAGKKDRALDLYKKLKKDYPTTQFARDADRNIARVSI